VSVAEVERESLEKEQLEQELAELGDEFAVLLQWAEAEEHEGIPI
jgi:hypothetical protein